MDKIEQLRIERKEALDSAQAIVATAKEAKRDLTDGEAAEIETHTEQARAMAEEMAAEEAAEQERFAAVPSTSEPLRPRSPNGAPHRRDVSGHHATGHSYSAMFGPARGTDGFKSFGDYLSVVDGGRHHDALVPSASMLEGTDSKGGFLVPETYAAEMLDKALEREVVRPRARVHPMKSDTLKISGLDDSDHSSTLFGGLSGTWVAEAATQTATDAKTRLITLTAKKLFLLTHTSNELLADGQDFENLLAQAMVEGMAWWLDKAFLTGSGAGEPLGVTNDPALVTVDKVAGQTAATVWYRNVVEMFSRLHPACYQTAVWCINPTCIPQLLQMNLHDDTAGSGSLIGDMVYPAFQERDGKFSLFGREVVVSEKLPRCGTAGDIILADFSQYSIGLRREVTLQKSIHPGFASDTSYFRAIVRCDAQGRWSSALTPANGDSLSWCVALETRD